MEGSAIRAGQKKNNVYIMLTVNLKLTLYAILALLNQLINISPFYILVLHPLLEFKQSFQPPLLLNYELLI